MTANFDIAIVGSGFAGSLMAMIARRLGRSVVVLERRKHPRFVIGESSTPLANLLLDQLCSRYDLPQLRDLTKWGAWQRSHPKIGCGLKRGFTFYSHKLDKPFSDDQRHRNQLLVAASPRDEIADTHWYRPDFDRFLAQQAQVFGAEIIEEIYLNHISFSGDGATISGVRNGNKVSVHANFVIDASGPRGFLHRTLDPTESKLDHMPVTQGLFTHFTDVCRWDALNPETETPPYPVDDAAVHHVFDGGWIWVLRFNNGITSAGVALTESLANDLGLSERAPAWERLLLRLPSVHALFQKAKPCFPFVYTPKLAFRSGQIVGSQWAMLPSAAGFIDPLLSTGFPLALLGVKRLSGILETAWESKTLPELLRQYASRTLADLQTTERLIASLYATMHDFELYAALTKLYFAAVSFTECALRLGQPETVGDSFLLMDHPEFGPRARRCMDLALERPSGSKRTNLLAEVYEAIQPVNVAGLDDGFRRNWHPARAEDLLNAPEKLGVRREKIEEMLIRSGFVHSDSDPA